MGGLGGGIFGRQNAPQQTASGGLFGGAKPLGGDYIIVPVDVCIYV